MPQNLPMKIAIKDCLVLILLVIFNTIHITDMANNNMEESGKETRVKDNVSSKPVSFSENEDYLRTCPSSANLIELEECTELYYPCVICERSLDCRYGALDNYTCNVRPKIMCNGPKIFNRTAICRFCYQTEKWEHRCELKANCNSVASPLKYYFTNCTVADNIECLGKRRFLKKVRCSWTSGTRWGTALILALTLGGFGADRFYLGHWQEGIGKLFSFGGLGVWTLVDALLIGIHHLGPADGSLFI